MTTFCEPVTAGSTSSGNTTKMRSPLFLTVATLAGCLVPTATEGDTAGVDSETVLDVLSWSTDALCTVVAVDVGSNVHIETRECVQPPGLELRILPLAGDGGGEAPLDDWLVDHNTGWFSEPGFYRLELGTRSARVLAGITFDVEAGDTVEVILHWREHRGSSSDPGPRPVLSQVNVRRSRRVRPGPHAIDLIPAWSAGDQPLRFTLRNGNSLPIYGVDEFRTLEGELSRLTGDRAEHVSPNRSANRFNCGNRALGDPLAPYSELLLGEYPPARELPRGDYRYSVRHSYQEAPAVYLDDDIERSTPVLSTFATEYVMLYDFAIE